MRVKGKDRPVKIYKLLTRRSQATPEQQALVQEFYAALAEYKNRNWERALRAFQTLLERHAHDGPAKLYAERCTALMKNPPPEDWDGVYTLTIK